MKVTYHEEKLSFKDLEYGVLYNYFCESMDRPSAIVIKARNPLDNKMLMCVSAMNDADCYDVFIPGNNVRYTKYTGTVVLENE